MAHWIQNHPVATAVWLGAAAIIGWLISVVRRLSNGDDDAP